MSIEDKLRQGFKAVKDRWDTKEDRDRQRQDDRLRKLRAEEAKLDRKLNLRKTETRVRKKKRQSSPLGRLLFREPEKPKARKKKKRSKKKAKKKKKDEGFTLPVL